MWRQTKQGRGVGVQVCLDLHMCNLKSGVGFRQFPLKRRHEQRAKLMREGDTTPANRIANPRAKALSGRSLSLSEAGVKQVGK